MTGRTVWNNALAVLNYTDGDGNVSASLNTELNKRSLVIVNQILADVLHCTGGPMTELETLGDKIPLCDEALPVLVYGVASLLALSAEDGTAQQMYATLYNQARSSLPRRSRSKRDVIPYPVG